MNAAAIEPLPKRAAPFERPRGRRGVRGLLAPLVALTGLAALVVAHRHGTTSSSGGFPGYSYSWQSEFAHTTQAIVLWISVAMLVMAAAILWRARSRGLVALAGAALIAAIGGSAWSIATARNHASPRPAAFNALPLGLSQAAVRGRLGEPLAASAQATPLHGGATLPCLLYSVGRAGQRSPAGSFTPAPAGRPAPIDSFYGYALLCFANDRLIVRTGA